MEARAISDESLYASATACFEALKGQLQSEETQGMTHSDLERLLEKEGRELMRQLLQAHVDGRGPGEAKVPVVNAEGTRLTHQRLQQRKLTSVFGAVEVKRVGYGKKGEESQHPLDAVLNLPDEQYSLEVRRRAADAAAKGSFDEASRVLTEASGAPVPKRQVQQLATRSAEDFNAFYDERKQSPDVEGSADTGPILVLSIDQKGIVMRREDLLEWTRKAEDSRKHKMSKRLSRGEKRNAKRMANVTTVYTIAPFIRTPESLVCELHGVRDAVLARPKPEQKRVWASLERDATESFEEVLYEALSRDPVFAKSWVVLVDGSPRQLKVIRKLARKHGVKLTIVLDIIHVIEYLWAASHSLNGEGSEVAEEWVTERLLHILRGKGSDVAAGIRRSATLRRLRAGARKEADRCANYLLRHVAYMHYDEYLSKGFPIASGVIEGACRHLLKDRMDITGARWSLAGAEAVLKLRSLRASGDFDEYWKFHEARVYERTHGSQYAGGVPEVVPPKKTDRSGKLRLVR
jgi:hypothetical protein